MSVTTRDIAAGVAALVAFPLAINLPAALAADGSPHPAVPLFDRGGDDRASATPARPG